MTRYARSGNTQKHQKVPGDATPWRQLSKPVSVANRKETEQEKKKLRNKNRKLRHKNKQKALREKNISKNSPLEEQTESPIVMSEEEKTTPSVIHQIESPEKNYPVTLESKDISETSGNEDDSKISEEKGKLKTLDGRPPKKLNPSFLERLRMNRSDNGIILLPPQMERKIYNIKKAMRNKDLPPEYIKEVVRKERRHAELKFRKMNRPCLNCRRPGHVYANCPFSSQHGICFKCGSTEHTSSKCSKNISGYPFAKCFICKEEGHISRDCPKNDHGVYPNGGKCYLCGNVNHFRKDCPTVKMEKEEEIIAAHTIKEGVSVDLEIIPEVKEEQQPPKPKKVKVVKF